MAFNVDIGTALVDTDRYSTHVLPATAERAGRVELECQECKSEGKEESAYTVWSGDGLKFTLLLKALVRHETMHHANQPLNR